MLFAERGTTWAGWGHYVPERCVPNAEIEAALGLGPGWIESRTGIRTRHYACPDQALSDLARPAAQAALHAARADLSEVGLLLLATSTPDHLLPPTAPLVAHLLGLTCGAIDLAGACSGFLYALALADGFCRNLDRSVLVIGANLLSRRIDPAQVSTRVLFADAAAAVLLRPCKDPVRGLRAADLGSDGSRYGLIQIANGGTRMTAASGVPPMMHMPDGQAVFACAVDTMVQSGRRVMASAGLAPEQIDLWAPHQANVRIIDKVRSQLGLVSTRQIGSLDRHENSSAATIPLGLSLAAAEGIRLDGGPILLSAFGAGTIHASLIWQP
jgi:3-oxoacyl-[acyl-carrier-protein] synthase III